MPAFTFEKIAPPYRGAPSSHSSQSHPSQTAASSSSSPSANQPVQVIQVLGRFVEARTREGDVDGIPPRRSLPK